MRVEVRWASGIALIGVYNLTTLPRVGDKLHYEDWKLETEGGPCRNVEVTHVWWHMTDEPYVVVYVDRWK
jgi:hypothetical protein